MANLDQLQDKKRKMKDRYTRELQFIDNEIAKEKDRIKRDKEREKRQKEQKRQQVDNLNNAAYQSFVKDSMTFAQVNEMLKEAIRACRGD